MNICKEIVRKINEGGYYSIHEAVDSVIGNYDKCTDFYSDIEYHCLFTVITSIFKFDDGYVSVKGVFDFNEPIEEYRECNYKTKAKEVTYKVNNETRKMTVGERAKIDAKITLLKEIATKYGGEKTVNCIIQQLEEIKEKPME